MKILYDDCLNTTRKCISAAEQCASVCRTSGDAERERCATLARDCADIGRLVEVFMLRASPFAPQACGLHAVTCDALAEYAAKWPGESCCREALAAARACAVACRACATKAAA
jgi:hypothetical protein